MPPRGWRFIDLAALGDNRVHRYLLTLVAVILLPPICALVSVVVILVVAARRHLSMAAIEPALLVAGLAVVVVLGLILLLCVAYLHRRPPMSLISADLRLDWRRLLIGAGVEGVLLLGVLGARYLIAGEPVRFGDEMGWWLLPVLLLIPLQSTSEELPFRGYLIQALGRIIRSRIAIAVIAGILFGAVHLNTYGALTVPYLLLLSLFFSLVSLRDERLELTIGAHSAMNWVAIGLAGALEANPGESQLNLVGVCLLLVNGALFYGLTQLLVRVFCRPPSSV